MQPTVSSVWLLADVVIAGHAHKSLSAKDTPVRKGQTIELTAHGVLVTEGTQTVLVPWHQVKQVNY